MINRKSTTKGSDGQGAEPHPPPLAQAVVAPDEGHGKQARQPNLQVCVRPHFMTDGFDPHQPDYYWDFKITFTSYWHDPLTIGKRSLRPLAWGSDWRNTPSHWDFWQPIILAPGEILDISHLVKLHSDAAIIQGDLELHTGAGEVFHQIIPTFSCDCPFSQRNYQ